MNTPTPTGLEPTQTRRPWRATIRTALAVGIPAILLLPTVLQIVVDELGPNLPDRYRGWLLAAGVIVTAIAATITRIMALPAVELLLRRLPGGAFAAQPTPKPADQDEAGRSAVQLVVLVLIVAAAVWLILAVAGALLGGPR